MVYRNFLAVLKRRGYQMSNNPGKIYHGKRYADGAAYVEVITQNGSYPLPHFEIHSPTGFEWGYGGSGPADLAYSLLIESLNHLGPKGLELASKFYQEFKWEVIAYLPKKEWYLNDEIIDMYIREKIVWGSASYIGYRDNSRRPIVKVVDFDGNERDLTHVVIASPEGFEWGYLGSGPADLAYSILYEFLNRWRDTFESVSNMSIDDIASRYYQRFKEEYISKFDADKWFLPQKDVYDFLVKCLEEDGFNAGILKS